ncbi:MAG: hypothetical protein ACOYEN_04340 [Limnochordia bacterium]|jgi:hypothetical protein
MKKLALVASLVLCLMLASLPAFAAKDADIDWGTESNNSGHWGFSYTKGPDDEVGTLQPYFKIHGPDGQNRFNKSIPGAYIEDGQNLNTTIGSRLGVSYSPYVAKFSGKSQVFGVRISNYKLGDWQLDGTYVMGFVINNDKLFAPSPIIEPSTKDILLGAKGKISDIELNGALVRFRLKETDPLFKDQYFYNYSLVGKATPMNDLTVDFAYAGYQYNNDWLYNVDATWKYMPGTLHFRGGFRNSEIVDTGSKVIRGPGLGGGDNAYVADGESGVDSINKVYNRNNSINIGATTWFNLGPVSNELALDYDTTNPNKRDDFDDNIKATLDSDYEGFNVYQWVSVLVPDEETGGNRELPDNIEDVAANRYGYGLTVKTPPYELGNGFGATGQLDFDWDHNYASENRYHTIAGLFVSGVQDIWRLKDVSLDGKVMVDMPMNKDLIADPVKFAARAKYKAPNGVKFQVEYYSSADYGLGTKWIHAEAVHARYGDYRFYEAKNSPQGVRVTAAFPF